MSVQQQITPPLRERVIRALKLLVPHLPRDAINGMEDKAAADFFSTLHMFGVDPPAYTYDVATAHALKDADGMEATDAKLIEAVGRVQDFSGGGFLQRDIGWECKTKAEADQIAEKLRALGMAVTFGGLYNRQ